MNTIRFACLALIYLCTCATATERSPLTLEDLTRIRQVTSAQMSPDGQFIAFTITESSKVYERPHNPGKELYLVDKQHNVYPFLRGPQAIGLVRWSRDSQSLWFLAKRQHDEYVGIYRIATNGGEAVKYVAFEKDIDNFALSESGERLLFWAPSPQTGQEQSLTELGFNVTVADSNRDRNRLYVVSLAAGESRHAVEIPLTSHVVDAQWHPDEKRILLVSAASSNTDDIIMGKSLSIIDVQGKTLSQFPHKGKMGRAQFSPDGEYFAVIGSTGLDDPSEGRLLVAATDSNVLVPQLDNFQGHIVDVGWLSDSKVVFVAHRGTASLIGQKTIGKKPGRYKTIRKSEHPITRMTVDKNGDNLALLMSHPEYPRELFWYRKGAMRRMTDSNPWLRQKALATPQVVTYTARDGLEIEGLLFVPDGLASPAPTLLVVHGGPESHFSNGWLNRYTHPVSYAVSKGFVVFMPNYRGSTGRGVEFTKLGQRDLAGAEFNDLLDAKAYLVAKQLTDPDKVGITGASYGGYASSWAATRMTEEFAAAVSSMGASEQISKFGTSDIPTEMKQQHTLKWPWHDWQNMLSRSPLFYAEQARTPLLLLHGEKDARVHYSQSLQLYQYLKQIGQTPVRLILYPDEGHGLSNRAARLDYSARMMRWFEHFILEGHEHLPPVDLPHANLTTSDEKTGQ